MTLVSYILLRSTPSSSCDFGIIHGTFSFYCFDTYIKTSDFCRFKPVQKCSCAILDINLNRVDLVLHFFYALFSFGEHIDFWSVDSISRGCSNSSNSSSSVKTLLAFSRREIHFFFVRSFSWTSISPVSRWTITKTPRVAPEIRNCHCICASYKSGISLVVNSSARTVGLNFDESLSVLTDTVWRGNETMIRHPEPLSGEVYSRAWIPFSRATLQLPTHARLGTYEPGSLKSGFAGRPFSAK